MEESSGALGAESPCDGPALNGAPRCKTLAEDNAPLGRHDTLRGKRHPPLPGDADHRVGTAFQGHAARGATPLKEIAVGSLPGRNTAAPAAHWARGQPADFVKRCPEHNTLILGLAYTPP